MLWTICLRQPRGSEQHTAHAVLLVYDFQHGNTIPCWKSKTPRPLRTCHRTILVVQSSPKIEPLQELSFPPALHVKHEESAKPRRFRPTPKLQLACHLATIARSWAKFKFAGWLLQQPTETGVQSGLQPPIVGCSQKPNPGHLQAQKKGEFPPQALKTWAWIVWSLVLEGNAVNGLQQWRGPKSQFACNTIQIQSPKQQNNTKRTKNPQKKPQKMPV